MSERPPVDGSETPELAQIIPLRQPATVGSELTIRRGGGFCIHRRVVVDDNRRTVECRDCNAQLDPIQELVRVARRHEAVGRELTEARSETKALRGRIDLMRRIENNARSRVKRIVGSVPDKQDLDDLLDGALRAWVREGRVVVAERKVFTPEEARAAAQVLIKRAREAESA